MIAIDWGSNTFRVLEYDCANKKQINGYSQTVKTADGLAKTGKISKEAIHRVVTAIKKAQEMMDFSSHSIIAITTEALRRASNSQSVIEKIYEQTNVQFEIISGDKEAELTLLAIKDRLEKLDIPNDDFVAIDIGGGSSEVTFDYGEDTISQSFPVGIVTMTQSHETIEDIQRHLSSSMIDIERFVADVYSNNKKPNRYIATAGTPTTLASMKHGFTYATYDAEAINGTIIKYEDLDKYLKTLLDYTPKQREIIVGVDRYDLMLTGIFIYKRLFEILDFEECIIIDDGLREGIAIEGCT